MGANINRYVKKKAAAKFIFAAAALLPKLLFYIIK